MPKAWRRGSAPSDSLVEGPLHHRFAAVPLPMNGEDLPLSYIAAPCHRRLMMETRPC